MFAPGTTLCQTGRFTTAEKRVVAGSRCPEMGLGSFCNLTIFSCMHSVRIVNDVDAGRARHSETRVRGRLLSILAQENQHYLRTGDGPRA